MTVMDGDEHRDPDSEQGETRYEPEGDEALPAFVDGRTVVRPNSTREDRRLGQCSGMTP
jgi:hypothetical protein